jgi:TRAP-type transport system periplasmic protein
MKKGFLVSFMVIMVLILVISGCAAPPQSPASSPSPSATTPPPTPKVFEFKYVDNNPLQSNHVQKGRIPWFNEIEKRSNGRIKTTIYAGESLGKGSEHWNMLTGGVCDIANMYPSSYGQKAPLAGFLGLPFGITIRTKTKDGKYLIDLIGEKYLDKQQFSDFKVLFYNQYGTTNFMWGKNPVKNLEDAKGKIVAFTGGSSYPQLLKALGMSPESINTPDMYTALERGTIDGILVGTSVIESYKLAPVIKHITLNVDFNTSLVFTAMSLKAWNSLSPDLQKIMEETFSMGKELTYDVNQAQNDIGLKLATDAGAQVYNLPAAERQRWIEATAGVADTWAKDMDAKKLPGSDMVKDIRQLLAK